MKTLPLTDNVSLLRPEIDVYLHSPAGIFQFKIKSVKRLNKHTVVSFHGIADRETAFRYRNSVLSIDKERVSLREGEFLYEQIIGLSVVTTDGIVIGIVVDILETGANDVYVVKDGNSEYLIPSIGDVIKEICLKERKIIIKVMEGLLD